MLHGMQGEFENWGLGQAMPGYSLVAPAIGTNGLNAPKVPFQV